MSTRHSKSNFKSGPDSLTGQNFGIFCGECVPEKKRIIESLLNRTDPDALKWNHIFSENFTKGLEIEKNLSPLLEAWLKANEVITTRIGNPSYKGINPTDPKGSEGRGTYYKWLHLALCVYTLEVPKKNAFYRDLNYNLRNLNGVNQVADFRFPHYYKLLLIAMKTVNGFPESLSLGDVVYRGMNVKYDAILPHPPREKEPLIFTEFISTSTNIAVAEKFAGKEGTLFVISGLLNSQKVFKGMKHHSMFETEDEFLLWTRDEFQVQQILPSSSGKGVTLIFLTA